MLLPLFVSNAGVVRCRSFMFLLLLFVLLVVQVVVSLCQRFCYGCCGAVVNDRCCLCVVTGVAATAGRCSFSGRMLVLVRLSVICVAAVALCFVIV